MNAKIHIAASLMCCNPLFLGEEVEHLQRSGCDGFHVDIMDGKFAKNFAMSIRDIHFIRQATHLPIDAHLMVYQPSQHLDPLMDAGTDRVIIHPESCKDYLTVLQKIRSLGGNAGLALSHATDLSYLNEKSLELIDTVLVMAVRIGFAGQQFLPETLTRVAGIQNLLDRYQANKVLIEVDGAISERTVPALYERGAQKFVGGSSGLFLDGISYPQAIQRLQDSILCPTGG